MEMNEQMSENLDKKNNSYLHERSHYRCLKQTVVTAVTVYIGVFSVCLPLSFTHTHTKAAASFFLLRISALRPHPWSLPVSHHTHANWETASELWPGSAFECEDPCRHRCNEARDIWRPLLSLDSSHPTNTHTLKNVFVFCAFPALLSCWMLALCVL